MPTGGKKGLVLNVKNTHTCTSDERCSCGKCLDYDHTSTSTLLL